MLLHRREWAADAANDAVLGISCLSGSSPVTGTAIQGMVCKVVKKDNSVRRVALPAGTFTYTHLDVVSKAMAFLLALLRCFGPTEALIAYVCMHVRSFTTDFGTERGTIDVCDCLCTCMRWISGEPS
jgi:hypothetical protein